MGNEEFNKDKCYSSTGWKTSDDDFGTMMAMVDSKRYSWSLFLGHLMIEKLMKAYYVKTREGYPPYIHNLLRLAEMAELNLNEEQTRAACYHNFLQHQCAGMMITNKVSNGCVHRNMPSNGLIKLKICAYGCCNS
jgi:hypothetical protein